MENLRTIIAAICILVETSSLAAFGQEEESLIPLSDAEWEYGIADPGGYTIYHQTIVGKQNIGEYEYTMFNIDSYEVDWYNHPDDSGHIRKGNSWKVYVRIDSGRDYQRNEYNENEELYGKFGQIYIMGLSFNLAF